MRPLQSYRVGCCVFFGALTLALSLEMPAVKADTASVSGALYKLTMGAKHSSPVPGANVYVHAAAATSGSWLGPNLTDQYGRFTFYDLPPGQYVLRIFSSTIRLWQQSLKIPPEAKLGSIVIPDVRLVYFTKQADPRVVADVLQEVALPYDSEPPKLKIATNAIWFGDLVPIKDVKRVADALIGVHVSLCAVRRFSVSNDWHAKILEVGSSTAFAGKPLSAPEVDQSKGFPRATGPSEDQL